MIRWESTFGTVEFQTQFDTQSYKVRISKGWDQISANNLTTLRYSKITRYSAINLGRIVGQFRVYNSTRVIRSNGERIEVARNEGEM